MATTEPRKRYPKPTEDRDLLRDGSAYIVRPLIPGGPNTTEFVTYTDGTKSRVIALYPHDLLALVALAREAGWQI